MSFREIGVGEMGFREIGEAEREDRWKRDVWMRDGRRKDGQRRDGRRNLEGMVGGDTLQKNSQEISVTSSALARPQPIRQGNFLEIETSLRK
jgi:hypothetical protein